MQTEFFQMMKKYPDQELNPRPSLANTLPIDIPWLITVSMFHSDNLIGNNIGLVCYVCSSVKCTADKGTPLNNRNVDTLCILNLIILVGKNIIHTEYFKLCEKLFIQSLTFNLGMEKSVQLKKFKVIKKKKKLFFCDLQFLYPDKILP